MYLIHSDYIETLAGGPSLHLNKWILSEPDKLNPPIRNSSLNLERVSFKLEHKTSSQGFVNSNIEIMASKVLLGFSPDENDGENVEAPDKAKPWHMGGG